MHLWRCEGEQARRRLATLREDPQAKLIEGALACLEGRHQAALDLFATIESDASTRAERLLWQAEAEFALGNPESALARVGENIRLENSLAGDLIMFWILAATRPVAEMAKSIASRTFLDAMVSDVLPSMVDADRLARAHQNPREFVPVLRELLDAMGRQPQRQADLLRRDDAQSSQRRLERIEVPPTGRDAAVENLVRVRTEPPERVLAARRGGGRVPSLAASVHVSGRAADLAGSLRRRASELRRGRRAGADALVLRGASGRV